MTLLLQMGLLLLFMTGSALFSGLETGGYILNRLRLRFRVRQGHPSALRLHRALNDTHRFIFTVLIGNNIAVYLLSRQVTGWYLRAGVTDKIGEHAGWIPWNAETAATLTLILPLFVFAELLPKNLFRLKADRLMYPCARILRFFQWVFWPITILLKLIFHILTRGRAGAEGLSGFSLSLEGLREYFSGETPQKTLTDHQQEMIDNLVSMHRIQIQRVMKSTAKMVSVSEQASVRQVVGLMQDRNVEHVFLFRGSSRRHFTGTVSILDLLNPSVGLDDPVRLFRRKLNRISATQSIAQAFCTLRTRPETAVLVQDHAGKTVGILQLRDIAGYIVSGF